MRLRAAASGRYFVDINKVCEMRDNFAFARKAGVSRSVIGPAGGKEKATSAPCFAINAHFISVYVVVCVLAGRGVRGGAGTGSGAATSSRLFFFVVICSRRCPGVTSVAELLSAALMGFLLGPKPRATFCSACAGLVCPPPPCLGTWRLALKLQEGEGRAEGEGILAFI